MPLEVIRLSPSGPGSISKDGLCMTGTLGTRIRECRNIHGLTQRDLARRAEITVGFLSDLERDKRNPSGKVLLRLANALSTTMDYVLQGVEAPTQQTQGPIQIPTELSQAAVQRGMSYQATLLVIKAYSLVVIQRSAHQQRPSVTEWIQIYDSLRKFIEK